MSILSNPLLLPSLLIGAVLLFLVSTSIRTRKSYPLPPGPRGLPIIGNVLQMPLQHEWLTFSEWGRKYGEVVYVSIFGRPIVILHTAKATIDLLEKRSAIYSDRPRLPMAGEMVGYAASIPLAPYGPRHREGRKLLFSALGPRASEELHPIQERKTREFLVSLLETPDELPAHIRLMVASSVFQVSHGYTVAKNNDPLINLAEQATAEFAVAVSPGNFLVDVFPSLAYVPAWFPGAGFKRKAQEWRKTMVRLRDEPWESVKRQIANGSAVPSFTASLLERNAHPTEAEEDIYKWASTGFYSAGADTTVSATSSFFLAMVLYPEAQQKAQAELDRVVGRTRLPTFEDRANLPYLEGLLMEVLRWNPVAPLALPHKLTKDDIYEGLRLPEGSVVFANSWAILHDPVTYPSPFEFKPERYLASSEDQGASVTNPDPRAFAFGYGRRVCPGQHLADASLYITIAMVLAAFNISNALDERGRPIPTGARYTAATISHPEPFKCRIVPRSNAVAALIHSE